MFIALDYGSRERQKKKEFVNIAKAKPVFSA